MEVDERQEEEDMRFVCKFCSRRFQCGKSLGGHIRTHLNKKKKKKPALTPSGKKTQPLIMVEEEQDEDEDEDEDDDDDDEVVRTSASASYRLRENPKKSWRFSDEKVAPSFEEMQVMKVCKECGKGFVSMKALCGHMACHSKKLQEEIEELVMDSESDTVETSSAKKQRRRVSKRLRESSSKLEVVEFEQEQEEVAISLMMLSRDSGCYKSGLSSFGESSDNNSVILEGKTSSIDMRISTKRGLCYGVAKVSGVMELKRAREKKLKCEEVTISANSDSGYYRHEAKKVSSDISVDGLVRNGELKKCRAEFEGYESYDVRSRRVLGIESEMAKKSPKEESYERVVDRSSSKYALRKCIIRPYTNAFSGVETYKNVEKSSKHELFVNEDHRASHTKNHGCSESMYESGENSIDSDEYSPIPTPQSKVVDDNKPHKGKTPKRSKAYECPFCSKVFKSGQALGGHKRSHFVEGCEVKSLLLKQEQQEEEHEEEEEEEDDEEEVEEHEVEVAEDEAVHPTLFDLNLPAPMEEEATRNFEYMSW